MAPDICDCHAKIENIHKANDMIKNHYLYRYTCPSEFVSWSSSLLFVLAHAIRKQNFLAENNVQVRILDVRKLPKDMAIYPLKTLFQVYDMPHQDVLWHYSYCQ